MAIREPAVEIPATIRGRLARIPRTSVPWRSKKFWQIQGAILLIMMAHTLVERLQHGGEVDGVPAPLTASLMLLPVLYSAVNFGASGAIATTAWATTLFALHWTVVQYGDTSSAHLWIELVSMAVLATSGIIVGQRVDVERLALRRTENALQAAALAETRYHGLFEHQPSPALVTDNLGTLVELNVAARKLLGPTAQGKLLEAALGFSRPELESRDGPITLRSAPDSIRHYMPFTHRIDTADGRWFSQIVLADVTDEYQRGEDRRAFTGRILEVQEEERLRLSRELHDDPLQQLMFLTRTLDEIADDPVLAPSLLGPVREGLQISQSASKSLREIIHGLRPPLLDDFGIVPALRQMIGTIQQHGHLKVVLRVRGTESRLPADLELTAYRVVQEALHNVAKHANANRATVTVIFGADFALSVRDDGRGIATDAEGRGLGLTGIRERVDRLGGSVTIRSHPGKGTVIGVSLPTESAPGTATPPTVQYASHHAGRDW